MPQPSPLLRRGLTGLCATLLLGSAAESHAFLFSAPLDAVQTEEDAYELYYEGNLEEEELERVLTLLQDPVDLNSADREELYDLPGLTWPMVDAILEQRERQGVFKSFKDLALIPELPPDVVEQLQPFSEVRKPLTSKDYLRSSWSLKAGWTPTRLATGDETEDAGQVLNDVPPTFYLKSHNQILRKYHFGFGVTEGQELAPLLYKDELPVFSHDAANYGEKIGTRPGYLTDGLQTTYDLAKIYFHTHKDRYTRWSAIAGSYRIGFGMGTVFDDTSREYPKGWKADTDISRSETLTRTSPVRYRDNPGLFGAAVSLHRLDLETGHLSGHLFGSRIDRNSYQDLRNVDPAKEDYRSLYLCRSSVSGVEVLRPDRYTSLELHPLEALGGCRFFTDPATGKQAYKLSQVTVLDALRETTFGGNFNWHLDSRTQVGITAYHGFLDILLDTPRGSPGLELSPSSKYPERGLDFGAIGGHVFWGLDDFAIHFEGAHAESGGNAFWLRGFYTPKPFELEIGLRSYDPDYVNPFTSPFAEPDEMNGSRARDERGINYKLGYRPFNGLQLRLKGDVWRRTRSQCWVTTEEGDGEEERELEEEATECLFPDEDEDISWEPVDSMFQELSALWRPLSELRVNLRTSLTDKNLAEGGRDEAYDTGAGTKLAVYGELVLTPTSWLRISGAYRAAWVDDSGARKIFDPDRYAQYMDRDRNGQTWSTYLVDEGNTDCLSADGVPKYIMPSTCRGLFDDRFRMDQYAYGEVTASLDKTTGSVKFKYYDEAVGDPPSIVGDQGDYWMLTLKLRQSKTFDLFAGSIRYDLLKFTDDRVRWYIEDIRPDQGGRLLYQRFNHQLTLTADVTF